jgi:hypothetical protein
VRPIWRKAADAPRQAAEAKRESDYSPSIALGWICLQSPLRRIEAVALKRQILGADRLEQLDDLFEGSGDTGADFFIGHEALLGP